MGIAYSFISSRTAFHFALLYASVKSIKNLCSVKLYVTFFEDISYDKCVFCVFVSPTSMLVFSKDFFSIWFHSYRNYLS